MTIQPLTRRLSRRSDVARQTMLPVDIKGYRRAVQKGSKHLHSDEFRARRRELLADYAKRSTS